VREPSEVHTSNVYCDVDEFPNSLLTHDWHLCYSQFTINLYLSVDSSWTLD